MTRPIRKTAFASSLSCLLAFSLLTASDGSAAQDFSHDGNRWYEVEVSIFRHAGIPSDHPEETLPGRIDPGYPARLHQLGTVLDALKYDFAPEDAGGESSPRSSDYRPPFDDTPASEVRPAFRRTVMGPPPAVKEQDFRLPDPGRDAFLRIEDRASEFSAHNQLLRRSTSHRLLWHAVWRQPVFNRSGAQAILVTGGERYGRHHELEGSLMLSFNVNRIDVDARLWVSTFEDSTANTSGNTRDNIFGNASRQENGSSAGRALASFSLPPVPGSPEEAALQTEEEPRFPRFLSTPQTPPADFRVTDIGYMQQRRAMISHELHYLDHPDFGVLIEVRPYQLPDPLATD